MSSGFLGNDAPLLLDLVVCALVVSALVLAASLFAVRGRRRYRLHKRLQLALAIVLLAVVAVLEYELQVRHGGWLSLIAGTPDEPGLAPERIALARRILWIHLFFAISTPLIWGLTIALALRRFPNPPRPSTHSRWHARLGWTAAADLLLTAITGIAWYAAVFVFP